MEDEQQAELGHHNSWQYTLAHVLYESNNAQLVIHVLRQSFCKLYIL